MEAEGRALASDLDPLLLVVTLTSLHLDFLTREVLEFSPLITHVSNKVRQ